MLNYRQEISPETLAVWHRALNDLPDEAYLYACEMAAREEERYPVPATIRRLAASVMPKHEPAPYHLRALPAPDEARALAHRMQMEILTRDETEQGREWQARIEQARARWRKDGTA